MLVGRTLLVTLLAACGSDGAQRSPDAGGADAAAPDSGRPDAGVPDAAVPDWACACEVGEDCTGCFENIGRCCYDDVTLGGQIGRLSETCARTGGCASCCSECAAKSCAELEAGLACPAMPPP